MNNFTLEIWDNECSKVTFYSVRKDGAPHSETELFFLRMYKQKALKSHVQRLMSHLIYNIGETYGAIDPFFSRVERNIVALPHRGKISVENLTFGFVSFPLRLFAMRLVSREDIVILFNGGIKQGRTIQESEDLSMKFYEAQSFAKKIEQAFSDEIILVDEKSLKLKDFNGNEKIQF